MAETASETINKTLEYNKNNENTNQANSTGFKSVLNGNYYCKRSDGTSHVAKMIQKRVNVLRVIA